MARHRARHQARPWPSTDRKNRPRLELTVTEFVLGFDQVSSHLDDTLGGILPLGVDAIDPILFTVVAIVAVVFDDGHGSYSSRLSDHILRCG